MKILYLYTEVMGYTLATIRELAGLGAQVHVVHWDHRKLSEFRIAPCEGVHFYPRSKMSVAHLMSLASGLAPDITVVSGWQDRDYLPICRMLRGAGLAVVCGFDDQWFGTVRQRIGSVLAGMGYLGRFFSHAWVTGAPQFAYARRFGFPPNRIVFDFYSGDVELFGRSYVQTKAAKVARYPHRFLFVGRLERIKGVPLLLEAWRLLDACRSDWELVVVGAGALRSKFEGMPGVRLTGFLQPEELVTEVAGAGCFVLPSLGEPWGVVVHEFAAAGLPILASTAVGAASAFVINGYNGFVFEPLDVSSLVDCMRRVILLPDTKLAEFSDNSSKLAQRITPCTSAHNLLGVITAAGGLGRSAS